MRVGLPVTQLLFGAVIAARAQCFGRRQRSPYTLNPRPKTLQREGGRESERAREREREGERERERGREGGRKGEREGGRGREEALVYQE